MKKKRVILSVINNLETDQRINRIATTLHKNGFDVFVVGSKNKKCHPYQQIYPTKRLSVFFKKTFFFYAEYSVRLFFYLLFCRVDILVANDTDTLLPNFLVSRLRRKKLVIDLHELFPEAPEIVNHRWVKKFWTNLEAFIFPHVKNGYTVSQSIADYYNEKYNMQLQVIRNVPIRKTIPDNRNSLRFEGKKIILYQGIVNVGRGIEWIMDAMPLVENAVFVIIGKGDLYESLQEKAQKMNLDDRVFFKGIIPFDKLFTYTCCADLGVCLLEKLGLSYYYSLPNRIFDLMHAHVPILATGFPEIAKIVKTYHTGEVIDHYEPEYLAQTINRMLAEPKSAYSFEKACAVFDWEAEEKKLLAIYTSL